jgi:arylamine N-acetyltransferase/uncharacterized RmlC-like cupin family protein
MDARSSQSAGHTFDLDAYLARIGLSGRPALAEMHRAHVAAIPFENLDPLRGVPVSLRPADPERKLVSERRGGYCFEHNLLFGAALRALGAEVEPMLARVGPRERSARSLSHLFLRVRAEGAVWHADVGFGSGTLIEPIPFGPGEEIVQLGWRRRIVADGSELMLQATGANGAWADIYSFTAEPAAAVDIEMSNWFTATHPDSRFVTGLVVTRNHGDGTRTVLSDWSGTLRLIEQTPSAESVQEVDHAEIPSLLSERMDLHGWSLDERGVPVPAGHDRTAGTEAWHWDLPGDEGATATADGSPPARRRPLFHVGAGTLDPDTAQTKGMKRFEALSGRHGGTEKIWLGENHVGPEMSSGDHHHGEAETGIYVISGHPVFVFLSGGEEQRIETSPGDYVFVPPYVPHREENPHPEPAVVLLARSTQEGIVVNLPSLDVEVEIPGGGSTTA